MKKKIFYYFIIFYLNILVQSSYTEIGGKNSYELSQDKDFKAAVEMVINEYYHEGNVTLFEAIKKGQAISSAQSANGIILDPYTGEILALAGTPSFNPNGEVIKNLKTLKNQTISEQYEPGSTLKVIPILEAISMEDINDKTFDCEEGEYYLPGSRVLIHDHEPKGELGVAAVCMNALGEAAPIPVGQRGPRRHRRLPLRALALRLQLQIVRLLAAALLAAAAVPVDRAVARGAAAVLVPVADEVGAVRRSVRHLV